jgi:predicted MPP superfamily phosphohydrolase
MWIASNSGPFELIELRVANETLRTLSFLHISDLHFAPNQTNKRAFLKDLSGLKPDLVINTGDNLGHRDAISPALEALAPLLELPGVFVNGSNDYREPKPRNPFGYLTAPSKVATPRNLDTARFTSELEGMGWLNLNNQAGSLELGGVKIGFLGVDDPHENLDALQTLKSQSNKIVGSAVVLGVAHAPYMRVIDAFLEQKVDLMFAGHTHGGQLCLPGKKALITNSDLNRKFASGLSAWGSESEMLLHVSQGAGHSIYAPLRLFCPPAATLIRFV